MKTDRQEEREKERRRKRARVPEEVKHIEYERERERIGRSEMEDTRSEKVRKGSVVLFGSCVAEAPTGRCYGGNVLFGPSRPTPWPVPSPRENSESRRERERERSPKSKSDSKFLPDDAPTPFILRGILRLCRVFRKEERPPRELGSSYSDPFM